MTDPQQVVVRWDDDTRALIAALYGVDHLERVEAAATAYLREQLADASAAAAQTPAPGAPPETVHRGEDGPAGFLPAGSADLAGGPGRAPWPDGEGHCPTCHATWLPITAYQCDGPPGAMHPRVRTVPGPPPGWAGPS